MKRIISCIFVAALLTGCASRTPKTTAEQYAADILAGDYLSFTTLFEKERQGYIHEQTFGKLRPTKCAVEAITPPYVTIRYRLPLDEDWPEETGVLYILPNGRIKYDPIFVMHPALALRGLLTQMENDDIRYRQSAFRTLTKWGLPLFGFTPNAEPKVRTNSVIRFRAWIEKNESTFDMGKVKIPVSPIDQERMEKATHNN
jgi:hypothetical protein